ncbi:glycosyltransferase family 9 protein, partial [candidate division KSB1 bacterium]|nr:glycosyltransferase family 9 protein [candidate division KSB1 bacterium]
MVHTQKQFQKILVIRTDRLGDVILTLPVLSALKASFPVVKTAMMLRSYTAELVDGHPDVDEIILLKQKEPPTFRETWVMARDLKQKNFDAALVIHPTFRLALLCYLAKIPIRVGTGFRSYSFLFNQKVFHHRKKGEKHELDFNLDLALTIGAQIPAPIEFKIHIAEPAIQTAQEFIKSLNLTSGQKWAIIHPGSGGSAKDWPLEKFAQFNDRLQSELGVMTVVTGGPDETDLVMKLTNMTIHKPYLWIGQRGLKELAALIREANLFISNSTGPLHLAVAVKTPVIGFFCPIVPCLPRRWGPYHQ